MKLRPISAILAVVLLAPTAYAADDNEAIRPKDVDSPASRPAPSGSCAKPCMIYRISTRCECPLRSSPPAAAA